MQIFDVITVGDSILDTFVQLAPDGKHYHTEREQKELCLMLGEKIPVDSCEFYLGGNASNVAVGLSRLGFAASLAAELGTDVFAQKIHEAIDKEKVNKSLIVTTPNTSSTFSIILNVGGDRTLFVRHVERQHNIVLENVSTKWVYLTSLGENWRNMYDRTLQFVQASGAKLAFNPGSMQMKAGIDTFKDVVASCDLLFVNREEGEEILYGKVSSLEEKETPETLLFRLQRMGPKMVVITDGENGAHAIDQDSKVYSQGIFRDKVTEKTGAGDAFSTGFLGALLSGQSVQHALLWGAAESAGVIGKVGAESGLLTKEELEHKIQENT